MARDPNTYSLSAPPAQCSIAQSWVPTRAWGWAVKVMGLCFCSTKFAQGPMCPTPKPSSKVTPTAPIKEVPKGEGAGCDMAQWHRFSPSIWIDFSSPSSSTSTRSRPFSIILQADRWVSRKMVSQQPGTVATAAHANEEVLTALW